MTVVDASSELTLADYQALARFRAALRAFLQFSEQAARGAGLTPAQHQLVLAVKGWEGGGMPSISDLAVALRLRHHSAVELVARAEEAGLVTRVADPGDGRRQLLALTARGDELLAKLVDLHRDELRRFRQETLADLLDVI